MTRFTTLSQVALILISTLWQIPVTARCNAAENYALLIGCTQYPTGGFRELVGARNDVAGFHRLLKEKFQFEDVVTLSGWPDDPQFRPTHDNIHREFEQLIEKAQPNSQIVVLMAGHGFRFPLPESQSDVLDPNNREPDGLDEAFLAADYHAGNNMILDNQIGNWLDQLKAKGAHTLIIFDSCFSGTMTRGESGEVSRELTAGEAGISTEALMSAQQRAREQLARMGKEQSTSPESLDVHHDATSHGSVVAFYAAQEFETAPEVTRPLGANSNDPRFKHGLLSYHLEQELRGRRDSLTYRDLGRSLTSRYRADGRRRPTPFWEGDLDREVLGFKEWPENQTIVRLEQVDGAARLTAGSLQGLSKNTILSVFDRTDKEFHSPLGYVRILETTPTSASIESIAQGGLDRRELASFPENSFCKIVSQELGDARIRLWLEPNKRAELAAEIDRISKDDRSVFRIVDERVQAQWVLLFNRNRADRPSEPDAENTTAGAVLMPATEADGSRSIFDRAPQSSGAANDLALRAKFQPVELSNSKQFGKRVSEELEKVFVWGNLWLVAKAYEAPSELVPDPAVTLSVQLDNSIRGKFASNRLNVSDSITVNVVNTSYKPYWYILFYLDGRYGVTHVDTGSVRGRRIKGASESEVTRMIDRFTINGHSVGANGFIVIAVAQKEHPTQPDYRFLAQSPVGVPNRRTRAASPQVETPFEKLLLNCLGGDRKRFRSTNSLDNPQISSWSWVTVVGESKSSKARD